MNRFYSDTVKTITPYVAGEQPKDRRFIKLNTNENPYPASPKVIEAIRMVSGLEARLYPDPEATALRQTLAAYHGLAFNQVFVGNGSDEVLGMIYPAFFNRTDRIGFPDITYSFYPVYAGLFAIPFVTVPLSETFAIDFRAYPQELKAMLVANPNAPTAIAVPAAELEQLLQERPDTLIVVDEAYVDFGAESVIPLIGRYDNLLVVQTMSKARSLAGLRVGMAFGHFELIKALEAIRDSFNSYTLDVVAQRAAIAGYEDKAYFEHCRQAIIATRERTVNAFLDIGIAVLPSNANFIFCQVPGINGAEVQQYLRDKGVLVRRFNKPRIEDWLRITIGTDEEMKVVIDLLRQLVASRK